MVKYINAIECLPAQFQKWATVLPDGARIYQPELMVGTPLEIVGLATVEVSEEVLDGTRRYTTKLAATLREPYAKVHPTLTARPVSLLLTATDGTRYIMGLACRPHPLVQTGAVFGGRPSDPTSTSLTATWKGIHPLLEVAE